MPNKVEKSTNRRAVPSLNKWLFKVTEGLSKPRKICEMTHGFTQAYQNTVFSLITNTLLTHAAPTSVSRLNTSQYLISSVS